MARRWRWPPDTFVPPCDTSASSPSAFEAMKSAAWATWAASSTRSSGMPSSEYAMFDWMVPLNKNAFCGT